MGCRRISGTRSDGLQAQLLSYAGLDEFESVAGSLKIPDSAIPSEQLNRRSSFKQPSPSSCVFASCNSVQHALASLPQPQRPSVSVNNMRRYGSSHLICDKLTICMVWLEKQEWSSPPSPCQPVGHTREGRLNQAWVWPAALKKDARPYAKQLSLSASLEKQAAVPMRKTLRLKLQRLRQWELDIHYSSKEDLVGPSSLYPSA